MCAQHHTAGANKRRPAVKKRTGRVNGAITRRRHATPIRSGASRARPTREKPISALSLPLSLNGKDARLFFMSFLYINGYIYEKSAKGAPLAGGLFLRNGAEGAGSGENNTIRSRRQMSTIGSPSTTSSTKYAAGTKRAPARQNERKRERAVQRIETGNGCRFSLAPPSANGNTKRAPEKAIAN